MAYHLLVATEIVAQHLEDPNWRLFDCRHNLADPNLGERQYAEAHLPGARFAHLDHDLSGARSGHNGRHPLPDAQVFASWLSAQGLRPGCQVVAYDVGNGSMASRLWSMLRWIGHDAVAVLDGGLAKWQRERRPLSAEVTEVPRTIYAPRPREALQADAEFVAARLNRADMLLLDARAPQRFRGESEPIDPVAGRIPGALNRFCNENLIVDGCFKSGEQLRREYVALLGERTPREVVHYCGSGVAACQNQLAMELAGLTGSRVYTGSWSEWIADPERPRQRDGSN